MNTDLSPLEIARYGVMRRRLRYCDLDSFMQEAWRRHHLSLGANGAHYDKCHKVLLVDNRYRSMDPPFPVTLLVRPYLRRLVEIQGPEHAYLRDRELLNALPPMYFARPIFGDLAVVDIDAAYFQIYSPTTLDLIYHPPLLPHVGRIRFLETGALGANKELRNAVIGILHGSEAREGYYGEVKTKKLPLHFARPELWGYVCDVLQSVALQVRERFSVHSVATDGFVVPASEADDLVGFLRDSWSLRSSVRATGLGSVTGCGEMVFGDEQVFAPTGQLVDTNTPEVTPPFDDELRKWFVEAVAYKVEHETITDAKGRDWAW